MRANRFCFSLEHGRCKCHLSGDEAQGDDQDTSHQSHQSLTPGDPPTPQMPQPGLLPLHNLSLALKSEGATQSS